MSKEPSYVRCIKPNHAKQAGRWGQQGSPTLPPPTQCSGLEPRLRTATPVGGRAAAGIPAWFSSLSCTTVAASSGPETWLKLGLGCPAPHSELVREKDGCLSGTGSGLQGRFHIFPGNFDEVLIRHQVKYLGLMENLRVRRAGFAYRRKYEVFLQRYSTKTGVRAVLPGYLDMEFSEGTSGCVQSSEE